MRRFPRRVLPALSLSAAALLAVAACASTGNAPIESAAATNQSTLRIDGGGTSSVYQAQITHSDRATESELLMAPDRAFAILPLVYEQVGLKINTAVSDSRTIGVSSIRTRRVGKDPMSRFLTCGTDITGNALADTYGITLTVLSRVTSSGPNSSMLSTQVLGTAQPMSTSGSAVACQSTGVLEDRIAKATALRTAN